MITAAAPNETLRLVHQLTDLVARNTHLDELLEFVFGQFDALLNYDRLGYAFVDAKRRLAVARWAKSHRPLKLRPGFSARLDGSSLEGVLRERKVRIIDDLAEHLRHSPHSDATRLLVEEGMRSSLTCPLVANGKPVGMLFFTSVNPGQYGSDDIELIEDIADHLAISFERVQLREEVRRAEEQLANQHEHHLAVLQVANKAAAESALAIQLKKSLFPASLPQPEGYRLVARFQPGAGDGRGFMDAFPLPEGRLGILTADCSNHGPRSFLLMSMLHTILRLENWQTSSPAQILAHIHALLAKSFPYGNLGAAMVAVFDPAEATVQWANADQPAPLLVRPAGYVVEPAVQIAKQMAGDDRPVLFDVDAMPLGPGDKFLILSPGLLEARFQNNAPFGRQQLRDTLEKHAQVPATQLLDHLWEELNFALQGEPPVHDLFAMVVERSPQNVACLPKQSAEVRLSSWGWQVTSTAAVADH